MSLYSTPAKDLDKFIYDSLQPNMDFLRRVSRDVDTICSFLKENCFRDSPPPQTKVLKVVKGGSSGKGTALKGASDADLVVFLSVFKSYSDQKEDRKEIIEEIRKKLEECVKQKGMTVKIKTTSRDNARGLSFTFNSLDGKESTEFDVLPAYDALGQHRKGERPAPQVYIDLIDSSSRGGEFSPCFTELQRDFVVDRPTKLKSLIRLVKYWYKEHIYPCKSQLPRGKSLPPKYALELLAVYAWERGSQKTDFDMAEGFRTVLWLIQQYRQLCIFWTINYNFQDETLGQYLRNQLQKPRPVILDPADPTGNLGEGCWDLVAQEAAFCSQQICCTTFDGRPVAYWDVPTSTDEQEPPKEETSYCAIL
uniref:2'-5' oligoadenylate synthase n=1 Tax=Pogona vitticeps TaxID=103695 RepID=A0ABM5F351_9SAUR